MTIDLNTIISLILTAIVGYISWSFKDRDSKKDARIQNVEKDARESNTKLSGEVKEVRDKLSENDTKYYKDFVTKEQHDMDINALMKKLDETNGILREVYKDIGTLIGRNQGNGK